MFYAVEQVEDEWIELESSRDRGYLVHKYPNADIIGGW